MIYPNENNNQAFYAGSEKDILLEVDLNGKIRFDILLYTIYNQLGIIYKIVNADLEYINGNNFGNIQLQLKVNDASLDHLDSYLKKYKLVNSKIDIIQKKEAS
jgi:ABC-type methionine transport system ATPase subunit